MGLIPSSLSPIAPICRSASTSSARRRFSIDAGNDVRSIGHPRSSPRGSCIEIRS